MLIDPEISAVNVVLIGRFNPSIFQPYWFSMNGLITEQAAGSAEIAVIHSDITSFSIPSLFMIQVSRDRFLIERTVAPWILISDMLVRVFGELLQHTPIGRLGINRIVHYKVKDEATREKIGLLLAPREPWGDFGKRTSFGVGSKHGGLLSLTLIQRDVDDRTTGWVAAKIEPSTKIGDGRSGIYMEVNDHYEIKDWTSPRDAQEMIGTLREKFDSSIVAADKIINQIMSLEQ